MQIYLHSILGNSNVYRSAEQRKAHLGHLFENMIWKLYVGQRKMIKTFL